MIYRVTPPTAPAAEPAFRLAAAGIPALLFAPLLALGALALAGLAPAGVPSVASRLPAGSGPSVLGSRAVSHEPSRVAGSIEAMNHRFTYEKRASGISLSADVPIRNNAHGRTAVIVAAVMAVQQAYGRGSIVDPEPLFLLVDGVPLVRFQGRHGVDFVIMLLHSQDASHTVGALIGPQPRDAAKDG